MAETLTPPKKVFDLNKIKMNKQSLFFSPTDQSEILKTINNLKNKAGGEDSISGKALKILAPYISYPLANIFNMVMEKGIFPTHFKKADIIPIYKSGDKKINEQLSYCINF